MVDFIDYWNNVFWLVECLLDIYCDLVDLHHIDLEMKKIKQALSSSETSGSEGRARLRELAGKKFALVLNIVRSGVDVPVIFHFMNSPYFSSGFAGFMGTISSSISLYNLWGK